jgi:hypothetical protein
MCGVCSVSAIIITVAFPLCTWISPLATIITLRISCRSLTCQVPTYPGSKWKTSSSDKEWLIDPMAPSSSLLPISFPKATLKNRPAKWKQGAYGANPASRQIPRAPSQQRIKCKMKANPCSQQPGVLVKTEQQKVICHLQSRRLAPVQELHPVAGYLQNVPGTAVLKKS